MKETFMDTQEKDAYAMMNSGLPVDMRDPAFGVVARDMDVTYELTFKYNTTFGTKEERRALLSEILRQKISPDTLVRPPFYINEGHCLKLGRGVFINQNCTVITGAEITVDDGVMIGPMAMLLSVNHDLKNKAVVVCKPVHICKGAWIGARAMILPGVTVGENAVVAAGAVVTHDVAPDTVVAGVPAKFIKNIG